MCYKIEKQRKIEQKLAKELKDIPDFISDFFDRYKSAATKRVNWIYIRDMLNWMINNKYINKQSIAEINETDIQIITSNNLIKYLNELKNGILGRTNSLDSINTKKNVFSAFWNYLRQNKYVDDNVISHIPGNLYKSEKRYKEVEIPTDEQVEKFLVNITDGNKNEFNVIRNIAIVQLIKGSGIRSEELINMDINDLHLYEEDRPYMMILGKGNIEMYDKVYMSKRAKMYLEEYLTMRDIFIRERKITNKALFLSNENKRMSKGAITSFFERYSDGRIYPHMLRHWVGTDLYNRTNNIMIVQRQLRHKNLETAARYYVHMDESTIANAVLDL
jgi:site-specific recombinase XerD